MPEDLNALLNAHLDGQLSSVQQAKVLLRLKQPATARRYERMLKVRSQVRAALPEPSPEQSRRMWSAIRAQISFAPAMERELLPATALSQVLPKTAPPIPAEVPSPAGPEPWYGIFTRPWAPVWVVGLAGAAFALAWVFLINSRPSPLLQEKMPIAVQPSSTISGTRAALPLSAASSDSGADARIVKRSAQVARIHTVRKGIFAGAVAPPTASFVAQQMAFLQATVTPSTLSGSTEVERALADNQVDDMIDQFLTLRQQSPGPVLGDLQAAVGAQPDEGAMNSANTWNTVAYRQSDQAAVQDSPASPGVSGPVQGSKDGNGFWNWSPAAQAMNDHQWGQARVELQAASGKAGAVAERAFANSALSLLSSPGAPLEGTQPLLPSVGDLRVLGAGTWQLLVDSKLARFGRGVSVSLPGLRCDGDSFLLDLSFDRGEFSAGTHFTRVSGDAPVRVVDASKQPVTAGDFYAPAGADYDIPDRELRLR